jgi:hypothetical protein
VEVKGTGDKAFVLISPPDLLGDELVWLHFGRRYLDGEGEIIAYYVSRPSKHVTLGTLRLQTSSRRRKHLRRSKPLLRTAIV